MVSWTTLLGRVLAGTLLASIVSVANGAAVETVLTFTPVADASIKHDSPNTNYGAATSLEADNSPIEQFLLKFTVSGIGAQPVASAKLRLYNVNPSDHGGDFHRVADNTWSEGSVTWNNAPAADSAVLASLGAVSANTWYEVDLTSLIRGDGTYSLRVTSNASDGADYASREAGATGPKLVVTLSGPLPTPGPLAANAGADTSGNEGAALGFTGSATGGTSPYTFTWNFGDATTGSGPSVAHAYRDNGTYTVTLTARDTAGATATDTARATIANVAPRVIAGGPYTGTPGSPVAFRGTATDPGAFERLTYTWAFGDGGTASGSAPSHTYATANTYTVTLTVRDKDGGSGSATTTAIIGSLPLPGPLTGNAGPDQFGSEGAPLRFTGSATGGTSPYTFTWAFGDGATASGPSPTHAYGDNRTYTVTLTVGDTVGATATDTALATISNVAPAADAGGPYTGAPGSPITFHGTATDPGAAEALTYAWTFGDGGTASGSLAPSHTYATAKTYTVTLTVRDKDGGSGSDTATAAVGSLPSTSLVLTAAGDYGASSNTNAVLDLIARSGADAHLALGDLSYLERSPESAWCDYVKSHVGATFPFELVSGNHDVGSSESIDTFRQCLPNRLPGLVGDYGKEWYVDIDRLVRVIMITPNVFYDYNSGTHYTWLSNAIDGARAAGIPWVIVGMHKVCITVGSKGCEIGTGLLNLLVGKKVDLVLQAHDHNYQRSKQLALGVNCAAVPTGTTDVDCIADAGADGLYTKGAGAIINIVGTGGHGLYSVSSGDSEAGYFARWMGSGSWGALRLTITATRLDAAFVPAAGSFTDSFTIR